MILSVVIPIFNEEKRIANNTKIITNYLNNQNYEFEIIFVNDGSSDGSLNELKRIESKGENIKVRSYQINKGKGFAVKTGILEAKGDYVLFMDMDLATPIEEIKGFLGEISDYDIIIASRGVEGAKERRKTFLRLFLGRIGNLLIRFLVVKGIKDTQCGFKLFSKKAARKIFPLLTVNRWGFDFEIMYLAQKFNFRVREKSVSWLDSGGDSLASKVKLGAYLYTFLDLFKIRINDLRGKYKY